MSAERTDEEAAATQASTGITPDTLRHSLETQLRASHVDIQDMSGGCGQMFNATIVSAQFKGKPRLARHRLVNAAVKEEIKAIHAWTPKCFDEDEWAKEMEKGVGT